MLFAGALVLGGGLYSLRQQVAYDQEAQHRIAHYSEYSSEEIANACLGLPSLDQEVCVEKATKRADLEQREYERGELDLVAQQKMALWTAIMGIAALIGMALSVIGVWLVWTTFRETRRQAQIAQDNLEAYREAERGHLEVHVRSGTKSSTSDTIAYDTQMHNVGRSSVKVLSIHYDILKKPEPKEIYKGATFEEFNVPADGSSNVSPLIKARADIEKYPFLGGYVLYRCKFGQMHRTHFCYKITPITNDDVIITHFTHLTHPCKRERDWPDDT